jgi:hypothetical protein
MSLRHTDRYPGLRKLVANRHLVPIEKRLAALGGPQLADEPGYQLDDLRGPDFLSGVRATVAVSEGSPHDG